MAAGASALVLVMAGGLVASAGGQGQAAPSGTVTYDVVQKLDADHIAVNSATGGKRSVDQRPRLGDILVANFDVRQRGRIVGSAHITQTTTQSKGRLRWVRTSVTQLPQGEIHLISFITPTTKPRSGSVVGGTGAFAGARGTARFTEVRRGSISREVVTFTP
jgi:hypothetical protein